MTVLVGGVSELYQSDLDLGRLAAQQLRSENLGRAALVEDLHYGAVAVAQRLEELRPHTLVLVGAVRRDRVPGTVVRRRVAPPQLSPAEVQAAVGDAVTGYVHLDLIVDVASGFGVLPRRTLAVEVEPELVGPGERLSAPATAGLAIAVELVRAEVRRAPLLDLVADLRLLVQGDRLAESPAVGILRDLLRELGHLDHDGRWGHAFALRDRLRLAIASGETSEGMDHRDWGLWWGLIEELDQLESVEATPGARTR